MQPMKKIILAYLLTCLQVYSQEFVTHKIAMETDTVHEIKEPKYIILGDGTKAEIGIKQPALQVFIPKNPNGSSIMLIPGGNLYMLFSETEGVNIARWFQDKGISVYLYKYSLRSFTGTDAQVDVFKTFAFPSDYSRLLGDIFYRKAVADAIMALEYVRKDILLSGHGIDKLGIMGISIGGAIALEAAFSTPINTKLVISINGFAAKKNDSFSNKIVPAFIACDEKTSRQESIQSISVFQSYFPKDPTSELHVYSMQDVNQHNFLWENDLESWLKKMEFMSEINN